MGYICVRRKPAYKGKAEEVGQLVEHGAVEINDVSNDLYTTFKWNAIIHKLKFLFFPYPLYLVFTLRLIRGWD